MGVIRGIYEQNIFIRSGWNTSFYIFSVQCFWNGIRSL
ncbi:Uncharacterised protein [Vibrio cholerae]|nr:Uncharacterised protein [Vibrio cholerae]